MTEVLHPGFARLGTTFAVTEVLQPGFVKLGTTFAVTELLQPGFVKLGPDYTTNFFGNIVALFMDRYTTEPYRFFYVKITAPHSLPRQDRFIVDETA